MTENKIPKVGSTIVCRGCKVAVCKVQEIIAGGNRKVYAPCAACFEENILSDKTWERGPAEVDMLDTREVVRYIRDLLNLSELIGKEETEEKLYQFQVALTSAGYSKKNISRFIEYATNHTLYDEKVNGDGRNIVPRILGNR